MNHWPFIVTAYAVFFLVLAIDTAAPLLARRRLVARLRGRLTRQRRRS
jgi:heme exporter protein CcmD